MASPAKQPCPNPPMKPSVKPCATPENPMMPEDANSPPNKILKIQFQKTAENEIHAKTLYGVCSIGGRVERIAICRDAGVYALVGYFSVQSALRSLSLMNGKSIFHQSYFMKCMFSKARQVNITVQDEDHMIFHYPEEDAEEAGELDSSDDDREAVPDPSPGVVQVLTELSNLKITADEIVQVVNNIYDIVKPKNDPEEDE